MLITGAERLSRISSCLHAARHLATQPPFLASGYPTPVLDLCGQ